MKKHVKHYYTYTDVLIQRHRVCCTFFELCVLKRSDLTDDADDTLDTDLASTRLPPLAFSKAGRMMLSVISGAIIAHLLLTVRTVTRSILPFAPTPLPAPKTKDQDCLSENLTMYW